MRPITVSVGPLAAVSNITGAIPAGTVGCLNLGQTPAGGSNTSAFLGVGSITAGLLTLTSTVSGAIAGGMWLTTTGIAPNTKVIGPGPTPGTWRVYPSQTMALPSVNGNRVVTLDAPRQVVITNTEPAGNSYTVAGTDAAGNPISETLATNGAALTTQQNFLTITQISVALPTTAVTTVLTAATATSPLVMFEPWASGPITKQAAVSGAATFSVQISNDDPNSSAFPVLPGQMNWSNDPDATFVGATGNVEGSWAFVPLFARVLLTAGAGAVRATFLQAGGPYE
jgi:hypothetical protein